MPTQQRSERWRRSASRALAAAPLVIAALVHPTSATAQGPAAAPIPVRVDELAPGVYHVASSFFYTFAVVQGDSMVVVDLPDTEARSRAVLDTIRSRFPRTPVRLVVASHHHGDHIAGLPLTLRDEIPVVAHAGSLPAIERIKGGQGSASAVVRGVRDSLTIGSGPNAIRVYAVSNGHAESMLITYLPALRLLSAPDLAEQGPWEIERAALVRHVRDLRLAVDRVAPGHNPARPWTDFDPAFTRSQAGAVLDRAIAASGGEAALRSISATQASVSITMFRNGSGQWPGSPVSPLHLDGTETQDFENGRSAFSGRRSSSDGSGPFRIVATRDAGYEQLFGYIVRYDADSLTARARERLVRPERVLLTARTAECRMDTPASVRLGAQVAHVLRCTDAAVGVFRLRIDSVSALPLEVEVQRPSRAYERENTVTAFGAFREVRTPLGAVMLPTVAETRVGGRVTAVATTSRVEVVGAVSDTLFAVPERVRRLVSPPVVRVQALASGVEYLESDSLYYALAVATDDGVVIIESGETEHRGRAFLDTVRARFRGRRIRGVVATHHHADHLAGLPAVVDAGLTVFTHADNAQTVGAIFAAGESRRPSPGGGVEAIRGSLVLGAGSENELRLYAVSMPEAATHLVAYLPRHALLFVADVLEGPVGLDEVDALRRLGLRVDRVATAHRGLRRAARPDDRPRSGFDAARFPNRANVSRRDSTDVRPQTIAIPERF